MNNNLLISLVKEEAKKIKTFATKHEIENLDFGTLRPSKANDCIYGQMTGNCYNERSKELITKCAEKVFYAPSNTGLRECVLNGKPNFKIQARKLHYSPIEVFIYEKENNENGNNKLLIDYLKGEIETLNIK